MEKQTIGQFLSALRRSTGYTQQDVADKLGVSNKTVSCWERDASCPDISMIPAIAELYGVTCDEILRAKRSPVREDASPDAPSQDSEKDEKKSSAIFDNMLARYENTQKITVAGVIFAVVLSVILSTLILELSNTEKYWCFIITAVTASISVFVLFSVQYRLTFALPCDDRTFDVRKRMYKRKKAAAEFVILCAVYFIPYTQNYSYNSDYIMLGLAAVVFALLIIVAAELFSRVSKPEFYTSCNRQYAKKRCLSYTVLLTVAIVVFFIFAAVIRSTPQNTLFNSSGNSTAENIEQLERLASSNGLPEEYVPTASPIVTDQYAQYAYTVASKDFDESDLDGYDHAVVGNLFDKTYTVYVLYPVWHVRYPYTDETTGETQYGYKSFTMYNRYYQKAFLLCNDDGSYDLHTYNTYQTVKRSQLKAHTDTVTVLRFGAIEAVVLLILSAATFKVLKRFIHTHTTAL